MTRLRVRIQIEDRLSFRKNKKVFKWGMKSVEMLIQGKLRSVFGDLMWIFFLYDKWINLIGFKINQILYFMVDMIRYCGRKVSWRRR
jgi:hypothetical protein